MSISQISQNLSFKAFSTTLSPNKKINLGEHPNINIKGASISEVEYAKHLTQATPLGKDNLKTNFIKQNNGLVKMFCDTKPDCDPSYENFVKKELNA